MIAAPVLPGALTAAQVALAVRCILW